MRMRLEAIIPRIYGLLLGLSMLLQYLRQNACTGRGFCRRVVVELLSTTTSTLNLRRCRLSEIVESYTFGYSLKRGIICSAYPLRRAGLARPRTRVSHACTTSARTALLWLATPCRLAGDFPRAPALMPRLASHRA